MTTADHATDQAVDHDQVERAQALQPLLAANAARCEEERRIPDDNLAALDAAGLFAVLTPKRCGGLGATMATQLAVAAALGQGCASTAWVQTIFSVTTWSTSLLGPDAQAEVFAGATPPRVCGVLTPTGTAAPVPGGYRVQGRWGFASGSLHADWAMVGVELPDVAGHDMACIPLSDLTIDDTWFVAGMRGTGSNTLVATDVFVPTHRLAVAGHQPAGGPPAPSDRWPIGGTLALVLIGPLLGVADAARASVVGKADKRAISYTTFARQIDSSVVLSDIARASLDLDTARMHAFRAAADIDAAGAGGVLPEAVLGRIRGSVGYACETLRRALDTLVNIGGASSFAEASALQRHWRDINVGSRHAFLATAPTLEIHARSLFALPQITDLV